MRVSCSKLELAERCQYPFRGHVADAELPGPGLTNEGATNGTAVHAQIEALLWGAEIDPADLLPEVEVWREKFGAPYAHVIAEARAGKMPIKGMRPPVICVEQAFGLDVETGRWFTGSSRRLGPAPQAAPSHRDYTFAPRDGRVVVGTADMVIDYGGRIEVWDWKTGRTRVPHPARNRQLAALAVMAARAFGATTARVGIVKLDHEDSWFASADLDGFALEMARASLGRLMESLEIDGRATPGAWCRDLYCPLVGACPATAGALAVIRGEELPGALPPRPIASNEDAARWYHVARVVERQLAALWDELKAWAHQSPFPVAPGRVYGPGTSMYEGLDGNAEGAAEALRQVLGPFAGMAMDTKITKAGIARAAKASAAALKERGTKTSAAAEERNALQALRELGAISMRPVTTITERDAEVAAPVELPAAPLGT